MPHFHIPTSILRKSFLHPSLFRNYPSFPFSFPIISFFIFSPPLYVNLNTFTSQIPFALAPGLSSINHAIPPLPPLAQNPLLLHPILHNPYPRHHTSPLLINRPRHPSLLHSLPRRRNILHSLDIYSREPLSLLPTLSILSFPPSLPDTDLTTARQLLTVSSLSLLSLLFTFTLHYHYRGSLSPRINVWANTALLVLWCLGLSLLVWNINHLLADKCSIVTWSSERGVMVCRLYKALTAFTILSL